MILLPYDRLPDSMQCDEVKAYYDILDKKRGSLILKRALDIFAALILLIILLIPTTTSAVQLLPTCSA